LSLFHAHANKLPHFRHYVACEKKWGSQACVQSKEHLSPGSEQGSIHRVIANFLCIFGSPPPRQRLENEPKRKTRERPASQRPERSTAVSLPRGDAQIDRQRLRPRSGTTPNKMKKAPSSSEDEEYFFARSSHSTRALVDRRVAHASNPKDIRAGLTAEQVQFTKAYVVDALLVGGRKSNDTSERTTCLVARTS
jgi:hypothetical protein